MFILIMLILTTTTTNEYDYRCCRRFLELAKHLTIKRNIWQCHAKQTVDFTQSAEVAITSESCAPATGFAEHTKHVVEFITNCRLWNRLPGRPASIALP